MNSLILSLLAKWRGYKGGTQEDPHELLRFILDTVCQPEKSAFFGQTVYSSKYLQ